MANDDIAKAEQWAQNWQPGQCPRPPAQPKWNRSFVPGMSGLGQTRKCASPIANVRCWGNSGSRFRVAGGLLVAKSGSSGLVYSPSGVGWGKLREFLQKRLDARQIRRVKALDEPAGDRLPDTVYAARGVQRTAASVEKIIDVVLR